MLAFAETTNQLSAIRRWQGTRAQGRGTGRAVERAGFGSDGWLVEVTLSMTNSGEGGIEAGGNTSGTRERGSYVPPDAESRTVSTCGKLKLTIVGADGLRVTSCEPTI